MYTAWYLVGLGKYVFNKNPGNSVRTRANLCFMESTENYVTDLLNFHQNLVWVRKVRKLLKVTQQVS